MAPVGVADEDVGRGSGDPPYLAFCKADVLARSFGTDYGLTVPDDGASGPPRAIGDRLL